MEQTMKEIRTKNPLGYQPIGRLLMKFAIPSVISMLVNAVYNIVDHDKHTNVREMLQRADFCS